MICQAISDYESGLWPAIRDSHAIHDRHSEIPQENAEKLSVASMHQSQPYEAGCSQSTVSTKLCDIAKLSALEIRTL